MRSQIPISSLAVFLSSTLASLVSAVTFDCKNVVVDGHHYDLSALGDPHAVSWIRPQPPRTANTTFTIDICKKLPRRSDVDKSEQCTQGTRICGTETINIDDKDTLSKVFDVAGDYTYSHGENRALAPKVSRLSSSGAHGDAEREGIRVELNGGRYPDSRKGTDQKAIIEFECDAKRTGLEDFEAEERRKRRAEGDEPEDDPEDGSDDDDDDGEADKNRSLRFISYQEEEDGKTRKEVLRLHWRTKYACEKVADEPDKGGDGKAKSEGWGFFTWFLIILFLGVAGYLIFGSWLNYSRYGARGWDLLPHGDTIRDIPYIVQDWGRSAVGMFQGGGSRGGYSAV